MPGSKKKVSDEEMAETLTEAFGPFPERTRTYTGLYEGADALKAGEEAAKDLAGKKKRPAAVDIDAMMKQMKDAARKADSDAKKAAEE